jgi:hypothetical protein
MKWVWIAFFVFVCTVSGFLGLTAGINLNPSSTVKFVPDWGSVGDWVSGIGALFAVLVTLWLADKQRREDVESVKVDVRAAILDNGMGGWFMAVTLISDGNRNAKVTSLSVHSPHASKYLAVTNYGFGSDMLPASLSYGDSISLHLPHGFERQIKSFVHEHCGGRVGGLKVVARTSLHEFSGVVHPNLLSLND